MATHKEKFTLPESQEQVMSFCHSAVTALNWKIVSEDRNRLQIRESGTPGQPLQIPVTIEVKILSLSQATGLELTASNLGFGSAQAQRVEEQAAVFVGQVRFEQDRPNYERLQAQQAAELQAEKVRKRERDAEAEKVEAAQREAARNLAMQQLYGPQKEKETSNSGDELVFDSAPREAVNSDRYSGSGSVTAVRHPAPPPQPAPAPPIQPALKLVRSVPDEAPRSQDTGGSPTDLIDQLERLAHLHQLGALTAEEFRIAKQKLLRG